MESRVNILSKKFGFLSILGVGLLVLISQGAFAESATLGKMADQVVTSFESVAKLITAGSYLAGLGFAIGGILKFKQHKDNPTQVTIGQPIALIFVAAALLFLPSILGVAGYTLFEGGGTTAGPTGTTIIPGAKTGG